MRVVVDLDVCDTYAICMTVAPEVFEVREDGQLHVLDEHPDESMRDTLETAARLCPTRAISLVD